MEPRRRKKRTNNVKAKSETESHHFVMEEIVVIILSKLPIKSLLRFRCVSKLWCSLISDPKFHLSTRKQQVIVVSKYFSRSCSIQLIDDEASLMELPKPEPLTSPGRELTWGVTISGSCNGLLLLSNTVDLFLLNASTRCCKKVLSHKHLGGYYSGDGMSGLCYDSSTDDYKLVMAMWELRRPCDDDIVMVGSLRNKTWTEVCFPYFKRRIQSGPTVKNRVHWLVTKSVDYCCSLIVGFDPQTNEFANVPMPETMERNTLLGLRVLKSGFGLGVLDGCLSLAVSADRGGLNKSEVEVFAMKEYGDQASWTSLFVLSNGIDLYNWRIWVPLCFMKSGEVLMLQETPLLPRISAHSLKYNSYRNLPIETKNCIYDIKVATFVESLVSPPCYNWEEEQEYMEIFLSGATKKWKREQGDGTFKVSPREVEQPHIVILERSHYICRGGKEQGMNPANDPSSSSSEARRE